MSAVYLWGARLSQAAPHALYNEDAFLVCTLQNIHQDLAGQHPHRVMHTIQAEVLLSIYYLTLGRPVEGIYHSSAAVSLAISSGLHLIRSPQISIPPYFGVLEALCPPPLDAVEEGERINAFWTVVVVNNYWVAAHGSPSSLSYDTPIDTPWPLKLEEYTPVSALSSPHEYPGIPTTAASYPYQQLFGHILGGATVSAFLSGVSVDGFSPLALLAKASILLERAIALSTRYSGRFFPVSQVCEFLFSVLIIAQAMQTPSPLWPRWTDC